MRDFTKYDIWNDRIELALAIYNQTSQFPNEEKFGLISQLRRSAVSISSNFAEGCSRKSEKEFNHFIEMSLGSAFEVKTQLTIAKRLKFIESTDFDVMIASIDKVGKQLNSLRNKLDK